VRKTVLALVVSILLFNVVIQAVSGSPGYSPALFIRLADGLYMLYEPPNTTKVEYTLYFTNSTWKFHAYTMTMPSGSCSGVLGAHQWDFWIIGDFPQLYPVAHEDNNLSNPLKPEFTGNSTLAANKKWVIVMRSGKRYYCNGWHSGGYENITTNLELPQANSIVLNVIAAQVGGWSTVDDKYFDSYIIIIITNGTTTINETRLLGGDTGGWQNIPIDISEFSGQNVTILIGVKAGGIVRVCEGCTGSWDKEFIGIDKIQILADNKTIFIENFQPINLQTTVTPTTTTSTTTVTTTVNPITTTTTWTPTTTSKITTSQNPYTTTTVQHTTQSPQPTQTHTNLPINIKDGDYLTYKIKVKGSGPEGSVDTSGEATLKIQIREGEVALQLDKSSLNTDAISTMVLFNSITDLVQVASIGAESTYDLPSLNKTFGPKCPVFWPGKDGEVTGKDNYLTIGTLEYNCKYSKGILTSIESKLYGSYKGQSFNIELKASLTDTSIEGVMAESGGIGHGNTMIIAGIVVALLVGAIIILVVRKR